MTEKIKTAIVTQSFPSGPTRRRISEYTAVERRAPRRLPKIQKAAVLGEFSL